MKKTLFLLSIVVINGLIGPRFLKPWLRRLLLVTLTGQLQKGLGAISNRLIASPGK